MITQPNMQTSNGRYDGAGSPSDPSQAVIVSTSPATGRKLGEVPVTPLDKVPAILAGARSAQPAWFRGGLRHRLALLGNLRESLLHNMDYIVNTLVAEVGKPPFEALGEFWIIIELVAHYQRTAAQTLAPKRMFIPLAPHRQHWVERRPFGVVLTIGPWNFPFLLTMPPIIAALVAGNTVIHKPSEFSTQSAEMIARVLRDAGFPPDVFQLVHGTGEVGAALIQARPDRIAFTGSVATGRKIAKAAGELLIPVTLELGAKDAAIVLEDADLERAAAGIVWGSLYNAGQACASIERVYVHRTLHETLVNRIATMLDDEITIGPGEAHHVQMGAITTEPQIRVIEGQVDDAIRKGARLVRGGKRLDDLNRRFYLPTLLTGVNNDMRLMNEETFGPVIAVVPFDSDDEVLNLVNGSNFGLTGSVWTRNRARGLAMAARLDVGHAAINDHLISSNLPHLPWSGTKESGYGSTRGPEGLTEMTRPQSFSIERFIPLPREFFWYPYTPFKFNLLRRVIRAIYALSLLDKLKALLGR